MRSCCRLLLMVCVSLCSGAAASAGESCRVVSPKEASKQVALAANEIRRYVFLRTGVMPVIERSAPKTGDDHVRLVTDKALGAQEYSLKTSSRDDGKTLTISGGSDIAVLYGAYHFVEKLGVRFYIHGDTIPDKQIPCNRSRG